jgi:hypothetical protein
LGVCCPRAGSVQAGGEACRGLAGAARLLRRDCCRGCSARLHRRGCRGRRPELQGVCRALGGAAVRAPRAAHPACDGAGKRKEKERKEKKEKERKRRNDKDKNREKDRSGAPGHTPAACLRGVWRALQVMLELAVAKSAAVSALLPRASASASASTAASLSVAALRAVSRRWSRQRGGGRACGSG